MKEQGICVKTLFLSDQPPMGTSGLHNPETPVTLKHRMARSAQWLPVILDYNYEDCDVKCMYQGVCKLSVLGNASV